MYTQSIPHWANWEPKRSPYDLTYKITRIVPVFLGGEPGTERIVLYDLINGTGSKAEIQKFQKIKNIWLTQYIKTFKGITQLEATAGYWELLKKHVAVIYYRQGSGNFLDYYIIGEEEGRFCEIVERIQIFMGDVWFEGGTLIESEGNRYRAWSRSNGKLIITPYRLCIIPGAKVMEYKITKDERVLMDKTLININPGDIVQVIRTDDNPVLERIMYYFTPQIKYMPHKSAFKFVGEGKFKFTIVPGGYNWENAVIATVEAK